MQLARGPQLRDVGTFQTDAAPLGERAEGPGSYLTIGFVEEEHLKLALAINAAIEQFLPMVQPYRGKYSSLILQPHFQVRSLHW